MAGQIPMAIAIIIICSVFFVLSLFFTEFIGAFYLEKGLPLVLFSNELGSIYTTMYAVPEYIEVNFSGTNLCRWNRTFGKYKCVDGLTIDQIGLAASHTTAVEIEAVPLTVCVYFSIQPLFQKIAGVIASKVGGKLASIASKSTKITRIAEALKKIGRSIKSLLSKIKARVLEKIRGIARRIKAKFYGFLAKIPYFGKRYKEELLFFNEFKYFRGEIKSMLRDALKLSEKECDEILNIYLNAKKYDLPSETVKRLKEFVEGYDLYKKVPPDSPIWNIVPALPENVFYEEMATELKAAVDVDWYLHSKHSVFRQALLNTFKKSAKGMFSKDSLFRFLSCRWGNWWTDLFIIGIFGMVIRSDTLFSRQFYSRYVGKVGALIVTSNDGDVTYSADRLIALDGEDFCTIQKYLTDQSTTIFEVKNITSEHMVDFFHGVMRFSKSRGLYDTLCKKEDVFYPNYLEKIVNASIHVCKNGGSKTLTIYLPPGRSLLKKEDGMLCEGRVGRSEDGRNLSNFIIGCINMNELLGELGCDINLGLEELTTNYTGPTEETCKDVTFQVTAARALLPLGPLLVKYRCNLKGDEYFDMWPVESDTSVKFEFPLADAIGAAGGAFGYNVSIPVLDQIIDAVEGAIGSGIDALLNSAFQYLYNVYNFVHKIEKEAYYQSRFDYYTIDIRKSGGTVSIQPVLGPKPCSYVNHEGLVIFSDSRCQS